MFLSRFIAGQLRRPNGLFGKFIMTRMLNISNKKMNDHVFHLLQLEEHDSVLEFGFGGGYLLEKICQSTGPARVVGVDFSRDIVEAGKVRLQKYISSGRLELLHGDIAEIELQPNSFNKICAVNAIYFLDDVAQVLNVLVSSLKSKGLLFLCFATKDAMEDFNVITRYGFNIFSVPQVQEFMEKSGLINVRIVPGKNSHGEFVVAVGEKY